MKTIIIVCHERIEAIDVYMNIVWEYMSIGPDYIYGGMERIQISDIRPPK